MGFLRRIESFLERLLRSCAGSGRQGSVQPVEIGRQLAKIMLADRRVSTVDVYVPNQYVVYLSPKDWEKLEALSITITSDISEYLGNRARRHGVKFAAPVQIEFHVDDNLPPGTLRGEATFRESEIQPSQDQVQVKTDQLLGEDSSGDSTNGTQVYKLPEGAARDSGFAQLLAIDGPDRGENWILGMELISLGRGSEQYVQLHDSSVSRCHAVMRLTQGRYWIQDNESKNGLRINGNLVKKAILADGDMIQLGTSQLQFRVVK